MAKDATPTLVFHGDHYRFRCRFKDGGRPWVELPPGMTKAKAQAEANKIARLARVGSVAADKGAARPRAVTGGETVAQWAERWVQEREARGLTSAHDDRTRLAMYVLPIIGPRPIASVTSDQIEAVVSDLDRRVRVGTMSWKTAGNVWGNVTKAFDDAAHSKDRTLRVRADNPAKDLRGPDTGVQKAKTFLFPSEAAALLSCELVPLDFRRAAALAIYLGVRAGELRSLRWGDVDFEHGTVHVHRGFDRDKHEAKATKTDKGRRFDIEPALVPLLEKMHEESGGEGAVIDMRRFFKSADDLRQHLRTAGVTREDLFVTDETRKNLTFHDLRATAITWWTVRGDTTPIIRERVGHERQETTEGYTRTAGSLNRARFGVPFAPLPASLLGVDADTALSPRPQKRRVKAAPPAGVGHSTDAADASFPEDSASQSQDEGPNPIPSGAMSPSILSPSDPVETALVTALNSAVTAGDFDAVKAIVDELAARRKARAGGVDLDAVRREREGR